MFITFKALWEYVRTYLRDLYRDFVDGWQRFWFSVVDPVTLGIVRLCTGGVLLYVYATLAPEHLNFIGPRAWIDSAAIEQLSQIGENQPLSDGSINRWWGQSLWMYVSSERIASALYGLLVASAFCFMIGLCSRSTNLILWIGHLSFVHRSYAAWYGLDSIIAMLLFYQLIGPTGAAVSVDAWWNRRQQKNQPDASTGSPESWTANLSLRMIQVHMCIIYTCSGLAKLQGKSWWDGTAVWKSVANNDLSRFDLRWVAHFSDQTIDFLSASASAVTIAWEASFMFLIWNLRLRPLILFGAVVLHGGIGIVMGLEAFAAIMLTGCLTFISPSAMRTFLNLVFHRTPKEQTANSTPESVPASAATTS